MCMRSFANTKITTAFNMAVSTLAAAIIGIILRVVGLPCWLVCGSVAATAVITEHFLTIYPLFILKYITFPIKEHPVTQKPNKKTKKVR